MDERGTNIAHRTNMCHVYGDQGAELARQRQVSTGKNNFDGSGAVLSKCRCVHVEGSVVEAVCHTRC
jgi:hypothetical protein